MNNSLLTDPHQKKLLKKWSKILESGKPIESESTKVVLAQVLENTREYYKLKGMVNEAGLVQPDVVGYKQNGVLRGQDGYAGSTVAPAPNSGDAGYGDYYLPNVVMPMLRRMMPDLLANELFAVQPLNGPVGLAFAYRPTYGSHGGGLAALDGSKNYELTAANEIGYNPVDTQWTGLTADMHGKELSAMTDTNAWDGETKASYLSAYSSNPRWWGEGAGLGPDSEYATIDQNYPTVSFTLQKATVTARTRKLAAHWSPELAEDMQVMHGLDVERELVNTLTYEIGAEIDRQLVSEAVKAAIVGGSVSKWTPLSADGLDQMGRLATLLTQITIEAQQIAIRKKRGSANFEITTPRIVALLTQMGMNKYTTFKNAATMPSVPDTGVGALTKVGLINDDSMLLVRDAYVQAQDSDYVLMGYKGKQAGDSGLIYCPYIPLQLSKVLQPGSFTPSVGARTRYGVMCNPWDAKNYYAFMKVEGCTAAYQWNGDRLFVGPTSPLKVEGFLGGPAVMPMA